MRYFCIRNILNVTQTPAQLDLFPMTCPLKIVICMVAHWSANYILDPYDLFLVIESNKIACPEKKTCKNCSQQSLFFKMQRSNTIQGLCNTYSLYRLCKKWFSIRPFSCDVKQQGSKALQDHLSLVTLHNNPVVLNKTLLL